MKSEIKPPEIKPAPEELLEHEKQQPPIMMEVEETPTEDKASACLSPAAAASPALCLPVAEAAASPDTSPVTGKRRKQKNTSRCFVPDCKKKIGLTGFKCRCGFFFCGTHRYADAHNCDFDYQAAAQDAIRKENPEIVAAKVGKI